jgi:diaminopimelate decarboxylase
MPAGGQVATARVVAAHADAEHDGWREVIAAAAARYGTPCYVTRWRPVARALASVARLGTAGVRVRPWLSFKTHPVVPLLRQCLESDCGVEVVSECEFVTALTAGADADRLLVNGVAKHAWLPRYHVEGLRLHFDSISELRALLAQAQAERWRVGVRCHAPDECDARDASFGGQFGMTEDEAVAGLTILRAAGVDVQGLHVHLGSAAGTPGAYRRAVDHLHRICRRAAFHPRYLDCGGGLPTRAPLAAGAWRGLEDAVHAAAAAFPELDEVWLENGRFVTERAAALVVRVLDAKEREDSRYLICDGGRTNQALAADHGPHPMLIFPARTGRPRLTTVCGPTCMTDDTLARLRLPADVAPGDLIAWMDAGAYHLPWETRFSHGQCAVVWCDPGERLLLARRRETPDAWAQAWEWSAA